MGLPPEAQILVINAVLLGAAYGWIYPAMPRPTPLRMVRTDVVLCALALLTAGALFQGTGERFSLVLFDVNWFWFAVISMALMETPLFLRFCRRHGIDLTRLDE